MVSPSLTLPRKREREPLTANCNFHCWRHPTNPTPPNSHPASSSSSCPPRPSSALQKFEFLVVALLFAGAAWLRFWHLVDIPGGFHGDEAVAGLEAGRILREGSIGPYSPLALGQPSGPLYLVALPVRLFGHTIWAVRAVSELLGTLTVVLLYFGLRRTSGRAGSRRWPRFSWRRSMAHPFFAHRFPHHRVAIVRVSGDLWRGRGGAA